jgi:predicted transcriptional regulator
MNQLDESRATWVEDEEVESAVLRQLLDLHPTQLTIEELIREMSGDRPAFCERDAVERAVRELAATGLLHRGGDFVVPTRTALRFSELLDR